MPCNRSTTARVPTPGYWVRAASMCGLLALAWPVRSEFHHWVDAQGRGHLSNVAPRAFDSAGRLRASAHPWSLNAQRAALADRLAARDAALAAASDVPVTDEGAGQTLPAAK